MYAAIILSVCRSIEITSNTSFLLLLSVGEMKISILRMFKFKFLFAIFQKFWPQVFAINQQEN